jgi:hypothetical protein
MPKTNLSLRGLQRAVTGQPNGTNVNLSNLLSGTNKSMISAATDGVSIAMPFTYIMEETYENLVFSFSNPESRFTTAIQSKDFNYDVNVNGTTFFSAPVHYDTVNAPGTWRVSAKLNTTGGYGGSTATSLSAKFVDGYNINATNYNTATTKDIYSVDTYNSINSDVMCISVDSEILMQNGSFVSAADLYVGDIIKTYVPTDMPQWLPENDEYEWYWWYQTEESGEIVDATISNIYYSFVDSYVSINDEALKVTNSHPLYIFDLNTQTYQFVRAEDIAIGDKLVKYNHEINKLENIDVTKIDIINETLEIATITVDVAHTYLANGFVSHNKGTSAVPIPWTNLVCYMDPQFSISYTGTGAGNLNDVAGNATGFNLSGGKFGSITLPTYNATSPKSLTFASGKYGIKEAAYQTSTDNGYNLANFNVGNTSGFTIIAYVNAAAGHIFGNAPIGFGFNFSVNSGGNERMMMGSGSTGSGFFRSTSATITAAGWNQWAVTGGAGTVSFYKNGSLVSSNSTGGQGGANGPAQINGYDVYLMKDNTGSLGSFLYYGRILTATEISNIHNNLKGRYGL